MYVCPSVCPCVRPSVRVSEKKLHSLQYYYKMSLIKGAWYVLWVKNRYAFWVTLRPQSDCYRRGEAEVRILNFKTTWSEFYKASQTATEQGEAELCILNFKTTWSKFQIPSQTAPAEAQPRYVYSISKPHGQSSRGPIRPLLRKAKPSCVYSILRSHGQPGYKYTILNKITSPESIPSSCVRQHT